MKKYTPITLSAQCTLLFLLISYQQHLSTSSENAASKMYIVYMGGRQHSDLSLVVDSHHNVLATVLGTSKELAADSIIYNYKYGFSGFAVRLTDSQAKMMAEMPSVVDVIPKMVHKLHTTRSWDYLGLSFSHATNNPYPESNMGDGIIVGVIDTGIWPESKSFSDQGLGPIPSRWKGACVDGDQFNSSHCNRKLIGARWHNKGVEGEINTTVAMEYFSPRDAVGHGTHTTSTAVGSLVHDVSFKGLALGTARGGAPRARLAVYKACWNLPGKAGSCTNVDVLKAVDEAIHDGVDVLSLSLGGPASPYTVSIIDIMLLQAVAKGITVVCSAGNSGPRPHTVEHVVPWIISVAASTMDRSFPSPIMLGNNRTIMGQSQFTGYRKTGFRDLGCPQDFTDAPTCNCEDIVLDSRMKGKVVLCFISAASVNNANVNSGLRNMRLSGVAGVIIAFYPTQAITCYDWHCIVVDYDIGTEIFSYTRSSRKPMVKLSPTKTLIGKPLSTKIADFSSRGPSVLSPGILKVYIVYMGERQHSDPSLVVDSHHTMLANVLGGSKEVAADSILYSYKHGFSGFTATLTDSQAKMIADTSGVLNVIPNSLVKLHTTRSWDYLGLSIPDHANTNLLNKSNMGDDTIIGVIDSGIWPESKSFSDQGLGPIPSRWKGSCEDGDQFNSTNCNRKLIGARWFIKGLLALLKEPFNATKYMEYLSPRDGLGHGTQTSAIAAGSLVPNVNYKGLAIGTARGGAPRARLATYKACWNFGMGYYCSSADVLKAFDEAIHDGVDVLSLSPGLGSPFGLDAIAVGSFHAVAKGITVVCSAGNSGPHSRTVENIAPWIISVAASTMDRSFPSLITLGNNQTILGQAMFTGHKEIGFKSLISPKVSDDSDVCICESLTPNNRTMAGKVVLCFGSTSYASLIASDAVNASGGVGLVIAKRPGIIQPFDEFPVFEVDYEVGTQILSYIGSSKAPVVKLSPSNTLVGKPLSAKIARFSSRGPSSLSPEILKPDIAAPGVNVLTAFTPNDPDAYRGFAFATGTSMSCAHVSGIVVLLKSLHPSWSPAAIRSALTTTGSTTSSYEEPIFTMGDTQKLADPFDYGGGIVNPNLAADPGLIYDMDTTDYVHYLCSIGYNKSAISALMQNITVCPSKKPSMLNLNLPSITIPNLKASEMVTRTVTNVGPIHSTYVATVEHPLGVQIVVRPQMLVFNSTVKKRSFTVTLSSSHKVIGGYYFGSLSWSDGTHRVKSPISVRTEIIPSYTDSS